VPGFKFTHPESNRVPRTIEKDLAAAQAFNDGALLVVNVDDDFAECGADPALVAAVSVSAAGSDTTGFNRFAKKEFPPGKMQGIALRGNYFTAEYVGTLPAADGAEYGVLRDTDSDWKVDFNEVANPRVTLVGRRTASPESVARVIVTFLSANIQII
jgi:hypothetical protein